MKWNNYVARWPLIYNGAIVTIENICTKMYLDFDRSEMFCFTLFFFFFEKKNEHCLYSRNRFNISFHLLFIIIVVVMLSSRLTLLYFSFHKNLNIFVELNEFARCLFSLSLECVVIECDWCSKQIRRYYYDYFDIIYREIWFPCCP